MGESGHFCGVKEKSKSRSGHCLLFRWPLNAVKRLFVLQCFSESQDCIKIRQKDLSQSPVNDINLYACDLNREK